MTRRHARFALRAVWFLAELLRINADYLWLAVRHGGSPPLSLRAAWLSRSSRRTLRIFGVSVEASGPRPEAGLLISNHLSYLDILVFSSLAPAAFVSKSEVRHWPVFGWFARMAGTIFVRRSRRLEAGAVGDEIRHAMRQGQLVVLFPEGTSTNGREVLPFKSSLLEPAVNQEHPLQIAHIAYALTDGSAEDDVCYWGDATFFPHFIKLMSRENIRARVRFAKVSNPAADRKQLAQELHEAVLQLKNEDSREYKGVPRRLQN